MPGFNTIEDVIEDLQNGRMVVLVDERDTDIDGQEAVGEGELMMLAELATAESINPADGHCQQRAPRSP